MARRARRTYTEAKAVKTAVTNEAILEWQTARIADQRIAGITHKRDILSLTQQLQKTVCTLSLIVLVMGNQSGMNTEMR